MKHLTPNQRAWIRFKRNPVTVAAVFYLLIILGVLLLAPFFSHQSSEVTSELQFSPPSWSHWFGTDIHGRDLFIRVCEGTRISLLVGAVGTCVSLFIGVSWGAFAGYLGGRIDSFLMRTVDILYCLPSIIFVIVLISTLEQTFKKFLMSWFSLNLGDHARLIFLFAGLGAVSWLTMARIVRGQVQSLRHRAFVEASRSLGAGHIRILFHHILPNISGIVIAYLVITVPSVVLSESFLSYLGLGIQPPQASLGSLIADGAGQINPIRIYWWLIVLPGGVLTSLLLALSFIGDGLRDAFDPRSGD